jgi:hypothetical protein
LRAIRLDPPVQVPGPRAASVDQVLVTEDLLQTGFHPADSSVLVRVRLSNQSRRPQIYRLLEATLEVRDLAGTPQFHGVIGDPVQSNGSPLPPAPSYTLEPGADQEVTFGFRGFPWYESDRPVRMTLRLPAGDDEPLDLVLADVSDAQSPRWRMSRFYPFLRTSARGIWGSVDGIALDVLKGGAYWSRGRQYLGIGTGFGLLYNRALLAGPPAEDWQVFLDGGWLPYRHCCGVYGSAEYMLAWFKAPYNDRYLRGAGLHSYPNLSAGIVVKGGRPGRFAGGPLRVEVPPTALGDFALRLGYVRWFNTGDAAGSGGFLLSLEMIR